AQVVGAVEDERGALLRREVSRREAHRIELPRARASRAVPALCGIHVYDRHRLVLQPAKEVLGGDRLQAHELREHRDPPLLSSPEIRGREGKVWAALPRRGRHAGVSQVTPCRRPVTRYSKSALFELRLRSATIDTSSNPRRRIMWA